MQKIINCKAIMMIVFFIAIIYSFTSKVNASDYYMTRTWTDYYYHASEHGGRKARLYINDFEVFCLEPDKASSDYAPYYYNNTLENFFGSKNQKKIDFFYAHSKNFTEKKYTDKEYVYMQLALWNILGFHIKDVGTKPYFTPTYGGSNGDLNNEFWSWYNNIERDYNYFRSKPTWNNTTVVLREGVPYELSANELLYAYRHNDIENLDINISNNKLVLTAKKGFTGANIRILKNPFRYYNVNQENFKTSYVYNPTSDNSLQKVVDLNFSFDPQHINLTVERENTFRIKKVGTDGEPIENVVFETSYSEDFSTDIWEYRTNADGYTEISRNWGKNRVYIREKSVPSPYIKSDEVKYIDMTNGQDYEITFTNERENTFRIKKVGTNGEPIENVVFEVSKNKDFTNPIELKTLKNGYTNINLFAENTKLYIREKSVPSPYIKSNEVKEIVILKNVDNEITFTNAKQLGEITVTKKGEFLESFTEKERLIDETKYIIYEPKYVIKGLEGVKISLYDDNNRLIETKITDKNGLIKFSNLALGTYKLKEVETVKGYEIDKTIKTVTLSYDENISSIEDVKILSNVEFFNKLSKVNIELNKNFEKEKFFNEDEYIATFGVYNKKQILNLNPNSLLKVITLTSKNSKQLIENLLPNEYYIKEIKTNNYFVSNKNMYDVNFLEDKDIKKILVENKLIRGSVKILKLDGNTKQALEGVKFGLYDEKDNLINEYLTDENGSIFINDLVYGKYYIKEIETLKGYQLLDKKYDIVIDEPQKEIFYEILNDKVLYDVKILKLDSSTKQALEGVHALILDENKNPLYEVVSNENGIFTFNNEILRLSFGKYYIKEIKSLNDYILDNTEHEINLRNDGTLENEIILYNNKELVQTSVSSLNLLYFSLFSISLLVIYKERSLIFGKRKRN